MTPSPIPAPLTRRRMLSGAACVAAAFSLPPLSRAQLSSKAVPRDFKIANGRIQQSIMGWTYNGRMDMMALARLCKEIGLVAMEGISASLYPQVRELGLKISLVSGGHGFGQGPCNPQFRDLCLAKLTEGIELAASIGTKNVITFTGMRYEGMDEGKAAQHCVDVWKKVMPLAESKGVNLVLEHLNSRDSTHPMKGHPGYFGDNVDFCADLVKRVGSPNMKLLFDIYHVAIMNGDIIRRIREYKELIAHYHTAGNPGRGELDETQELNFPAIMREIVATGYSGHVTHEFIPTWPDHELALRHAAMTCDV